MELCTSSGMATSSTSTMATPTAAPATRFLRLSREAASARRSSSPLGAMVEPGGWTAGGRPLSLTARQGEGWERGWGGMRTAVGMGLVAGREVGMGTRMGTAAGMRSGMGMGRAAGMGMGMGMVMEVRMGLETVVGMVRAEGIGAGMGMEVVVGTGMGRAVGLEPAAGMGTGSGLGIAAGIGMGTGMGMRTAVGLAPELTARTGMGTGMGLGSMGPGAGVVDRDGDGTGMREGIGTNG